MTKAKHTPEPEQFDAVNAKLRQLPGGDLACDSCDESFPLKEVTVEECEGENGDHPFPFIQICGMDYFTKPLTERIIQTYNALAGIENPAEFVAAARELLDNAKSALAAHEDIACSCKGCFELRPSIARASAALSRVK